MHVHAHHGRLDLAERFVADLGASARATLTALAPHPVGHYADGRLIGTLLALGMADLDHATTGARWGVRLIALALRIGHLPLFLPAMAAAPAEQAAVRADSAGYHAARAAYEQLDPDALRVAALAVLADRRELVHHSTGSEASP